MSLEGVLGNVRRARLAVAIFAGVFGFTFVGCNPAVAFANSETTGSVTHTWTNYTNAGGTQGPSIPSNTTVDITCRLTGFAVADGNTWWYQIGSSPWSNNYYASADAFYNNGATSGSLLGTPFFDPAVPVCGPSPPPSPPPSPSPSPPTPSPPAGPSTVNETTGSVTHTWTNYTNAGGTQGPSIASNTTVAIACRLTGFAVADGNTWWYQVASSPWNSTYYASADAFYNNGATSGSLVGTPLVDSAVPVCGSSSPPSTASAQTVSLSQGPVAPAGYRYAISLGGFAPNASVNVTCMDSADPGGFYSFSLKTNGSGSASTSSYCYSGQGPNHWVVAGGVQSNIVVWGSSSGGSTGGGGGSTSQPQPQPTTKSIPTTTSIRWAGYDATGTDITGVEATWTVPKVNCSPQFVSLVSAMSQWAGIDNSETDLIQAGTTGDCAEPSATPSYFAWWESLGNTNQEDHVVSSPIHPGDVMSVRVYTDPLFPQDERITLEDNGSQIIGLDVPATKAAHGPAARNEVECIVEAPNLVAPLNRSAKPKRTLSTEHTGRISEILADSRHRKHRRHPKRRKNKHKRHRNKRRLQFVGPSMPNAASYLSYRQPLANFGTTTFSSCGASDGAGANDVQLGSGSADGLSVKIYNMYDSSDEDAETGLASGNGSTWSVTWKAAT
jgi:hypothetical protein